MDFKLWCAPGVHMVQVVEDIVLLDRSADAYRCLLGAANAVRPGPGGAIDVFEPEILRELLAAGIATRSPPSPLRRDPSAPTRELPRMNRASCAEVFRAGVALTLAAHTFKARPLDDLIAAGSSKARRALHVDEIRLDRLVAAARSARAWVPFEGECLRRSYQLRHFLRTEGMATDWLFGVRTWPFAAHCWLQIGDLVVGDRLERVQFYTPILSA